VCEESEIVSLLSAINFTFGGWQRFVKAYRYGGSLEAP